MKRLTINVEKCLTVDSLGKEIAHKLFNVYGKQSGNISYVIENTLTEILEENKHLMEKEK